MGTTANKGTRVLTPDVVCLRWANIDTMFICAGLISRRKYLLIVVCQNSIFIWSAFLNMFFK